MWVMPSSSTALKNLRTNEQLLALGDHDASARHQRWEQGRVRPVEVERRNTQRTGRGIEAQPWAVAEMDQPNDATGIRTPFGDPVVPDV